MKKNIDKRKSKNDGLKGLREAQHEIIRDWKESGILDGLSGHMNENIAKLFESETSHIINEDPSRIIDD